MKVNIFLFFLISVFLSSCVYLVKDNDQIIHGVGYVQKGVEMGCIMIQAKNGEVYEIGPKIPAYKTQTGKVIIDFYSSNLPPLKCLIEFEGKIQTARGCSCMQGIGFTLTKWRLINAENWNFLSTPTPFIQKD